jgi:hypothetical protein
VGSAWGVTKFKGLAFDVSDESVTSGQTGRSILGDIVGVSTIANQCADRQERGIGVDHLVRLSGPVGLGFSAT